MRIGFVAPVVCVAFACAAANDRPDFRGEGSQPNGYDTSGTTGGAGVATSGSGGVPAGGSSGGSSLGGTTGAPGVSAGASNATNGGAGFLGTAGAGVAGAGVAGAGVAGRSNAASGAGGRGGAANDGGRPGVAGTMGSAGKASSASGSGNAGATSVDLPPVDGATFTDVYTKVISQYCFGSGCHNPSMSRRPDFSTQTGTYNYFKSQGQLYGGQDPQKSYIYYVMHGNPSATPPTPPYMPPAPNTKVPPDALAIVAGWIAGGAKND